jgi:Protein YTP1-like, C-terminal
MTDMNQCGMLIESSRIRDLLNSTSSSSQDLPYEAEEEKALEPPKSYGFSMNPLPALIVLLLGLMMSAHHQESMVSTMIHKQWGTLLLGGAFARGATYVIFYLSPPSSVLPSRPPTELITAFCLIAGGMLFMASVSPRSMRKCSGRVVTDCYARRLIASTRWRTTTSTPCSSSPCPWAW